MRIGVAAFPEGHVDAADLEPRRAGAQGQARRRRGVRGDRHGAARLRLRRARRARPRPSGADLPIIPGIMPILNLRSMERMVEFSRRQLPEEITARLTPYADDPARLRAEGIAIATELCETLLDAGAPGLHFYTLNRSKATREIFANLRSPSDASGRLRWHAHRHRDRDRHRHRRAGQRGGAARGRGARRAASPRPTTAMAAAAATVVEVAHRHTEERRVASSGISVWPCARPRGARGRLRGAPLLRDRVRRPGDRRARCSAS